MTGWDEEGTPEFRTWRHSGTGAKITMKTDINAGNRPFYTVTIDGGGVNGFASLGTLEDAWAKVNELKTNFSYRKKKSTKSKSKRKPAKKCKCK